MLVTVVVAMAGINLINPSLFVLISLMPSTPIFYLPVCVMGQEPLCKYHVAIYKWFLLQQVAA